jgi:hypothetical protein
MAAAEKISFQATREILIQDNIPFGEIKTIDRVMQSKTAKEKLTFHSNGERSISHIGFKMIK